MVAARLMSQPERPRKMSDNTEQALAAIAAERQRQISAEGYDASHDDEHHTGELARAASVYAIYAALPALDRDFAARYGPQLYGTDRLWPWDHADLKLTTRRAELIKAGALIVAEIERLDRLNGGAA